MNDDALVIVVADKYLKTAERVLKGANVEVVTYLPIEIENTQGNDQAKNN